MNESATQGIDLVEIQNVRALLKQRFPEIIVGYIEDVTTYFADMNEGVAADDMQKIALAAHPLKSSSASLGVVCVGELAIEIERLVQEGATIEAISPKVQQMKQAIENVKPVLQELAAV